MYSPGVALLYEVTRASLAENLDCDYLTGEQEYKMRFATSVMPLYRVDVTAGELAESLRQRSFAIAPAA
jgi:CelD/BcsL family acetyltransferase involved in cellulose biosynthesis